MGQFRTKLENNILKVSNACKTITIFDWVLLVVLCVFIYCTMLFDDLIITYSYGLCFWDCLFSGEIGNFYSYAKENSWKEWTACYYLPLYIIFAVCNQPVWILSKLVEVDVYSPGFLLWAKGILFLFLSSLNLFLSSLAMGQYDIICYFFLVWGLYEYCKDKKLSCKCLLIFAVAVTMKLFAIFVIIPFIKGKKNNLCYKKLNYNNFSAIPLYIAI